MKIYFAGSIRGASGDQEIYRELIERLKEFGKVLTEHVGNPELRGAGESTLSDEGIFQRDVAWIHQADIVVAEVTMPSLGVGYELGLTESLRKPVVCLFRETGERSLSAMVAGNTWFQVKRYQTVDEAVAFVSDFIHRNVP